MGSVRILPEMVGTGSKTDGSGRCGQQRLVGWIESQSEGTSLLESSTRLFLFVGCLEVHRFPVMMNCLVGGLETNDQIIME